MACGVVHSKVLSSFLGKTLSVVSKWLQKAQAEISRLDALQSRWDLKQIIFWIFCCCWRNRRFSELLHTEWRHVEGRDWGCECTGYASNFILFLKVSLFNLNSSIQLFLKSFFFVRISSEDKNGLNNWFG